MNIGETLENAIEDLRLRMREVEAAALVTVDGLVVAASGNIGGDQMFVGGALATALTSAERISAELDRGRFKDFFIRGENGFVLVTGVGEDKALALIASTDAKLGMLFLEAERLGDMLGEVLRTMDL